MQMEGAGPITGPALMAEIGDVRRFKNKKALVAFAGIDAPPSLSLLHISGSELWVGIMPAWIAGLVTCLLVAAFLGKKEAKRIAAGIHTNLSQFRFFSSISP